MTHAAHRQHDLPPLWDGRQVTWSRWMEADPGSLVFHTPSDTFACTGCGWIRTTQLHSIGRIHPEPVEKWIVDGSAHTAWPVAQLAAVRCPGCELDQVTDMDTGETWDIDPSDYTATGSWPEPENGTLF